MNLLYSLHSFAPQCNNPICLDTLKALKAPLGTLIISFDPHNSFRRVRGGVPVFVSLAPHYCHYCYSLLRILGTIHKA